MLLWSDDASRQHIYSCVRLFLMNDSPDHPGRRKSSLSSESLRSPLLWLNRYECIWYSGSVILSSVICHNYTLSGVTWLDKWHWHISPPLLLNREEELATSRLSVVQQDGFTELLKNYQRIKNSPSMTRLLVFRPHLCYGSNNCINIRCSIIAAVSFESVSQHSSISGRT